MNNREEFALGKVALAAFLTCGTLAQAQALVQVPKPLSGCAGDAFICLKQTQVQVAKDHRGFVETQALAQGQAPTRGEASAQVQPLAQAAPPAAEPYQHIPLPTQLPKGVSVKDAQHLQALIDDYSLQEPLVTTKVRDNIYMVRGGPGRNVPNSGFIIAKNSVIIIGNKNSKEAEELLLAEIAKVTPKPVKAVIVLHSQHESGVGFLPTDVMIIAHENAKKEMEVSTARDKIPMDRFPSKTVSSDETMNIDGVKVRLLHWGPGYTGGDLIVFFPAQKVIFAGDLIVSDFPLAGTFVDRPGNGTTVGWLANIHGMLTLNFDACVPGHGAVFTKNDVKTKLAFIQDKWDRVKAMVALGKSLADVKAAFAGIPEKNPSITEVMFAELTAKTGE